MKLGFSPSNFREYTALQERRFGEYLFNPRAKRSELAGKFKHR
jgi:hypothetical protein